MNYTPRQLIKESSCIALGDSHTWGVGNKETDSWAFLLGCVNFGIPGVSTDYLARTCEKCILKTNAEIAFFLWPDWTRFEVCLDNTYIQVLPTEHKLSYLYKDKDESWLIQNRENKIVEIEHICEPHKVLMVSMYHEDLFGIIDRHDRWPIAESTRNNPKPHYSLLWHKWVSELFLIKKSFKEYEAKK